MVIGGRVSALDEVKLRALDSGDRRLGLVRVEPGAMGGGGVRHRAGIEVGLTIVYVFVQVTVAAGASVVAGPPQLKTVPLVM